MRSADSVAAHLFQDAQLPPDGCGIDSGTKGAQIMMQTNAAYLKWMAV